MAQAKRQPKAGYLPLSVNHPWIIFPKSNIPANGSQLLYDDSCTRSSRVHQAHCLITEVDARLLLPLAATVAVLPVAWPPPPPLPPPPLGVVVAEVARAFARGGKSEEGRRGGGGGGGGQAHRATSGGGQARGAGIAPQSTSSRRDACVLKRRRRSRTSAARYARVFSTPPVCRMLSIKQRFDESFDHLFAPTYENSSSSKQTKSLYWTSFIIRLILKKNILTFVINCKRIANCVRYSVEFFFPCTINNRTRALLRSWKIRRENYDYSASRYLRRDKGILEKSRRRDFDHRVHHTKRPHLIVIKTVLASVVYTAEYLSECMGTYTAWTWKERTVDITVLQGDIDAQLRNLFVLFCFYFHRKTLCDN